MRVRFADDGEAGIAAALHAAAIDEGFLATLGRPFLSRLYRRIARWPHSFVMLADEGDSIVGMIAMTEDVSALYRAFLVRDGLVALLRSGPRLVRSLRAAVETLRYPAGGNGLPAAELLAVAVAPEARGQGIAGSLVASALGELAARGVMTAKVVVAPGNAPALALYRAAGFAPAARVEVHAGQPSDVLVWRRAGTA